MKQYELNMKMIFAGQLTLFFSQIFLLLFFFNKKKIMLTSLRDLMDQTDCI